MKLFSWLSKLVMTVVLVSVISIGTTFMMVNMYANKLLNQYEIPVNGTKLSITDLLASILGQGNTIKQEEQLDFVETKEVINQTPPPQEVQEIQEPQEPETLEVWNQQSTNQQGQNLEQGKKWTMSAEKFNEKKDLLTNEDKMKIFSIVITKIPQHEFQELSHLMEEGITQKELQDIDQVIQKYLDIDEYNELLTIVNKYDD